MLIECPKCGKQISDTAKTCLHCGEQLTSYVKCPECGTLSRKDSIQCHYCGYNFYEAKQREMQEKQEQERKHEEWEREEKRERESRKCRDCLYYNSDGGISKCDMYRKLFHPDAPKCEYYFYSSMAHEHNKCYLTTACVEYYGKPDDCYELQTLRNFRDDILETTTEGRKMCEEYYRIAPPIVDRLHKLNDSANYEYIYAKILDCIKYIENKEYEKAVEVYKDMCIKMQQI